VRRRQIIVPPPLQDVLGEGGPPLGAPDGPAARSAHGGRGQQGTALHADGCLDGRSHAGVADRVDELTEPRGRAPAERGHRGVELCERRRLRFRGAVPDVYVCGGGGR